MFDYLKAPERGKSCVTMVLDKGLGLGALDDLLSTAGPYVQVIKFGWGTTAVLDPTLIRQKIERIREKGILVCPGGTLLEMAHATHAVDRCLEEIRELGFTCVEVSDGTFEIPTDVKLGLIRRAREAGFTVVSEIGKKTLEEDARLDAAERVRLMRAELAAGAWKVIVEARESGSLGIFDSQGRVKEAFTEELVREMDVDDILFEAPNKSQQIWLMRRFGPQVNLGNVAPQDAISLETLRQGLRADTVKDFLLHEVQVRLELGVSGAVEAAARGDVVVVVDCLRSASTTVVALASGMSAVVPCVALDDCLGEGKISAGERAGKKVPGFTHGNSPRELRQYRYQGQTLYLSTTNGTECIKAAARGDTVVLVGCVLNARAAARAAYGIAKERGKNITVLTAGRNNKEAIEDTIGATEIVHHLGPCPVLGSVPLHHSADLSADFISSETGRHLIGLGYSADVEFCAQKDQYEIVPILSGGRLVPHEIAADEERAGARICSFEVPRRAAERGDRPSIGYHERLHGPPAALGEDAARPLSARA